MKLDKSPGFNEIPIEFYKTFWLILGPFLVKVNYKMRAIKMKISVIHKE